MVCYDSYLCRQYDGNQRPCDIEFTAGMPLIITSHQRAVSWSTLVVDYEMFANNVMALIPNLP